MPIHIRQTIPLAATNQYIRVGDKHVEYIGDADLIAENIDNGKDIFGVIGTQAMVINGTSDVQATYDGVIAVNDVVYLYLNGAVLHAVKSTNVMSDIDLGTSGIGYAKEAGVLNDVKTVCKIWGV